MAQDTQQAIGAPKTGSAEADALVAHLEALVRDTEETLRSQMVGVEEVSEFCLRTGLNALTAQIAEENGETHVFTAPSALPKKPKVKRVRIAI